MLSENDYNYNINNSNLGKKRRKTELNYKNGKHIKYSYDHLVRKIKSKLFVSILKL